MFSIFFYLCHSRTLITTVPLSFILASDHAYAFRVVFPMQLSVILLLVSRILMNFDVLPVQIRTTIRIELLPPAVHLFFPKLYNYRFYFMVSAVLWLLIGIDVTMSSFNVLPFFISEIYGWVTFFSFLFEFFYGWCTGLLLHRFMLVFNRFVVFVNL